MSEYIGYAIKSTEKLMVAWIMEFRFEGIFDKWDIFLPHLYFDRVKLNEMYKIRSFMI
jgi:hypothetical protein